VIPGGYQEFVYNFYSVGNAPPVSFSSTGKPCGQPASVDKPRVHQHLRHVVANQNQVQALVALALYANRSAISSDVLKTSPLR
jgi:hypothetical protein